MNNNIIKFFLFILLISFGNVVICQNLKEIKTPTGYTGFQLGYHGEYSFIFKDELYLKYKGDRDKNFKFSFFKLIDNELIRERYLNELIDKGLVFGSKYFIYDDHIYFNVKNQNNEVFLYKFDGKDLIKISNSKENTNDFNSSFIINNEKYFTNYSNNKTLLYKLKGDNLINIELPYNSKADNFIKFNEEVFFRLKDEKYHIKLYKFDGKTFDYIKTPDNYDGPHSGVGEIFTVHCDKLYLKYISKSNNTTNLFSYDGENLIEIKTHNGFEGFYFGVQNEFTEYGGNIYFKYKNYNENFTLFKVINNELSKIDNPKGYDDVNCGYIGNSFVYNGKLYLNYIKNENKIRSIFEYDGFKLKEIILPEEYSKFSNGYVGPPIEYKHNVYLSLFDGAHYLYKFNGEELIKIKAPMGLENRVQRYYYNPIIFKDFLYLQYYNLGAGYNLFKYNDK